MASMKKWVLSVELDGEWEECSFATHKEALAAFAALAKDYTKALKGAVLTSRGPHHPRNTDEHRLPVKSKYVN